ncbi:MAG: Fic family protein [Candidatus Aenigmarchaeota archaeon]|nr:Fic family protein [Candidatus Aenigmarchaeota archaeon]
MVVTKEETENLVKVFIDIHNDILQVTGQRSNPELHEEVPAGGESGVRDPGGLHVLAYKILSLESDPTKITADVATEALYDIATKHYFWDGNKRTAYVIAKTILLREDMVLLPIYKDALEFIIRVADKKIPKKEIKTWIEGMIL